MVRTQIQPTPDQHRRLKKWAQQRSISLSEAIRRFVTERLEAEQAAPSRDAPVREAMTAVGAFGNPTGADELLP